MPPPGAPVTARQPDAGTARATTCGCCGSSRSVIRQAVVGRGQLELAHQTARVRVRAATTTKPIRWRTGRARGQNGSITARRRCEPDLTPLHRPSRTSPRPDPSRRLPRATARPDQGGDRPKFGHRPHSPDGGGVGSRAWRSSSERSTPGGLATLPLRLSERPCQRYGSGPLLCSWSVSLGVSKKTLSAVGSGAPMWIADAAIHRSLRELGRGADGLYGDRRIGARRRSRGD